MVEVVSRSSGYTSPLVRPTRVARSRKKATTSYAARSIASRSIPQNVDRNATSGSVEISSSSFQYGSSGIDGKRIEDLIEHLDDGAERSAQGKLASACECDHGIAL
jgi:hypothetical protein